MPRLQIGPDSKSLEVNSGETILGASLRGGINHIHACGGKARCSTCRVEILEGLANCSPCTEAEAAMATRLHFAPEIRLACQTRVNGDVKLRRLALDDRDGEVLAAVAGGGAGSIGEEKRIAILFSDIRGFTSFSEKLPPYDVIHVLNRYFAEMAKPIAENHGCIDNYIGDGIMALFGMQQPKDVALDAIKAGLGMLKGLDTLRPYLMNLYGTCFKIGVGIHVGEAVVGTVGMVGYGENAKMRTTAIGDAVNFASRIESENKAAGTSILISQCAFAEVKDKVLTGKTVEVDIKGKTGKYILYEVAGLKV